MTSLLQTLLGAFSLTTSCSVEASLQDYLEKKIDLGTLTSRLQREPVDYSQMLKEFQAREIAEVLVRNSPLSDVTTQLLDEGVDVLDLPEKDIHEKALDIFTQKILSSDAVFQSFDSPSPVLSVASVDNEFARSDKVFGMRVAGCEEDVEKVKIKGDGHCMFRSYAFKLLEQLELKPGARAEILERLQSFKDLIMNPEHEFIQEQIPNFQERIDFLIHHIESGMGAMEALNDEDISNGFVHSLRVLACASNMINPDFNYIDEAGRFDHEFGYYQAMMNMGERLWGGEEESNAISRVLGTRSFVFNFTSHRVSVQAPGAQIPTAINICFYFKPGHYDALNISDVACQEIVNREALDLAFLPQE